MSILTKLSLSFQKKNIDIAVVQPLIQSTISQLEYLTENDGPYMTMLNSAITENHLEIKNHRIDQVQGDTLQVHQSRIHPAGDISTTQEVS
ncbi:hypothetical protein DPMN_076674 [Dreissena polymorpha]|uniref:Uncharacterized protein n=1 Tax=Dreissena polymorpha TaxID=45954 RepID=A0A9D3YJG3_DREPO|nr:hypothetical protein DPMN_076674 [Dreissena polymorpha]